jgi:AAA+ ATPase superfamily predicted ATPase
MTQKKCKFSKLQLKEISFNNRGVVAAKRIKKGDGILFVPKDQIITWDLVTQSPIAKKMLELGMEENKYGSTVFYVIYVLEQMDKPFKDRNFA